MTFKHLSCAYLFKVLFQTAQKRMYKDVHTYEMDKLTKLLNKGYLAFAQKKGEDILQIGSRRNL